MPVAIAEVVDVHAITRRCVEEQSPFVQERRIALVVDVPLGLRVLADAELLSRVVQNLLNNALKFTPKGGRVGLEARTGDWGDVLLSVADTGPGIAADELPHLFDPYHQAKARRARKIKGTGLGLAFCQRAATAMNGDIRVKSTPGSGSRFVIRLPAPAGAVAAAPGRILSGRARA